MNRFLFLLCFVFLSLSACSGQNHTVQHTSPYEIPAAPYPHKAVSADFNNDGKDDLAVILKSGNLLVFINTGAGFDHPLQLSGLPYSTSLVASDFNRDGNADIAVLTEVMVSPFFLGDGQGGFMKKESTLPAPGLGRFLDAADLNNDGLPDLIAVGTGAVIVYINKGDLAFEPTRFFMSNEFAGKYITSSDLDGNGYRDIVFSDYPGGKLYVLYNEGTGAWSSPVLVFHEMGKSVSAAVPLPLIGVPLPGLCLSLESSGEIVLLKNSGDKTFHEEARIMVSPMPFHLTVADMNRDGSEDIVITHVAQSAAEKGSITVLTGPFPVSTPERTLMKLPSGFPMTSTASDWDLDGFRDLFLTNYDTQTVTFIPSPLKK